MSEQNEQLNQKHRAIIAKAAAVVRARGHEGDARLADSLHGILASLVAAEDRRAQPAPTVQAKAVEVGVVVAMSHGEPDIQVDMEALIHVPVGAIVYAGAAPAHASSDGRDAKYAARYRMLRDGGNHDYRLCQHAQSGMRVFQQLDGEALDRLMDKAISDHESHWMTKALAGTGVKGVGS